MRLVHNKTNICSR